MGFTRYDFRYTYARKRDWVKFEHAICLAYEQDYEPTQTIPSIPAEIVHSGTYRIEGAAGLDLGDFIRSLGYHAQVHSPNDNTGPYIPLFVAAGLGQLGACGYLLTPNAGSRCRLMLITTDAHASASDQGTSGPRYGLFLSFRQDLRQLLGLTGEPLSMSVTRHLEAMPQYHVGHLDRVDHIASLLAHCPGLVLAGNAYHGVGIPDCIHSGDTAAQTLLAYLTT